MRKIKFFYCFEKEENWLERMAARGWRLKKRGFVYTFEFVPPEKANIKMDFRIFKRQEDFIEYITLMEDSGWQHLAGTKGSGNQYFMQIADNGDEDIFSDNTSRAGRYKRLSEMMLLCFVICLPFAFTSFITESIKLEAFINPKLLYYTPGLWETSGFEFWRKFLFETPFALMRGFSWCVTLLLFFSLIFFAIKSWLIYKKAIMANGNS